MKKYGSNKTVKTLNSSGIFCRKGGFYFCLEINNGNALKCHMNFFFFFGIGAFLFQAP